MKKSVAAFGTVLFAALALTGCAKTDTRQQELDLRERDLSLREKEFALKEKALLRTDSTVRSPKIVSANPETSRAQVNMELVVNPQKDEGPIDKATFSHKGKILFYFEREKQLGKISINGKMYDLTSLSRASNSCSYKIAGNQVRIDARNCNWRDAGGDCAYGKFASVKVFLNNASTTIGDVDLQDCPMIGGG